MAARKVYHVMRHEGGWQIRGEGARRASGVLQTRDEAVARAKELAEKHQPAVVKVQDEAGAVEAEYAFGADGQ